MASFIAAEPEGPDSMVIASPFVLEQIDLIRDTYKADIRNSGLKKLLILGKSGAGKSALCNALLRRPDIMFPTEVFVESDGPDRCTTDTFLAEVCFLGDNARRINLIDTIGLESNHQNNVEMIAKLVVTLKHYCDKIHLFGIVMDTKMPRLDARIDMIRNFELVFGKETFWKNAVILFTKFSMSSYDIRKRERIRKSRESDRDYLETLVNSVMSEFNVKLQFENQRVPYFILDSKFNPAERQELDTFTWEADKLYMLLSEKRDEEAPSSQSYGELTNKVKEEGNTVDRTNTIKSIYQPLLDEYPEVASIIELDNFDIQFQPKKQPLERLSTIVQKVIRLLGIGLTCGCTGRMRTSSMEEDNLIVNELVDSESDD